MNSFKLTIYLAPMVILVVVSWCMTACELTHWGVGDTKAQPRDSVEMVYVPAGNFLMGTSQTDLAFYEDFFPLRKAKRYVNEMPQRTVYVDAFLIDIHEVTNRQYQKFLAETGYQPQDYVHTPPHDNPDYPAMVMILSLIHI